MATETGRISPRTQSVNPIQSTDLINNHLEKVAVIAGAVASFALAIFALIGSAYLIAALSAAAGLSILYAFMKGEGTAAVPTPPTLPIPPVVAPVVTQPVAPNTGTNSGTTVQTTLTAQPLPPAGSTSSSSSSTTAVTEADRSSSRESVEEQEETPDPATSATTVTSSTNNTAVPSLSTVAASSSLLPPVPAADPSTTDFDEGSFLHRRTPDQYPRVLTRTNKFDGLPPEARQSSDTISVGSSESSSSTSTATSTESKHRRTQSDAHASTTAFEQFSLLGATASGEGMPRPLLAASGLLIAGAHTNPFTHMLQRSAAREKLPEEGSPIKFTEQAMEELDDILGGVAKHLDRSDHKPARRRAASHDELTSPAKRDLQGLGSHLQMEEVAEESGTATTSDGNGFQTPPPARKQIPLPPSGATQPYPATPALSVGTTVSFSDFVKSSTKNRAGLPRSPSNPDLRQMFAYRSYGGATPVGTLTAGMFNSRTFKNLTAQSTQKKH